jgi:hypothetical protein
VNPLGFFTPDDCIPLQLDLHHCPPAPLLLPPQNRLDLHSLHHRSPPSSTTPEPMRVKTLVTRRIKGSPAKSTKTGASKKRSRDEAVVGPGMFVRQPPWTRSRGYATLRRLPWLAQHTTPMGDEGPQRDTIQALLQHCSRTPFYHINPYTPALLEL